MRWTIPFILSCCSAAATAAPGTVTVEMTTLQSMARTPVGATIKLDEFPAGPGILTEITFERIDVYAAGARIVEIGPNGERELPRSANVQLIGTSPDRSTRVSLTLEPRRGEVVYGSGSGPSGTFVVRSRRSASGWTLSAIDVDASHPPGVVPEFAANVDTAFGPDTDSHPLAHLAGSEALAASTPARLAVVAVDTDNELMSLRFSNNTTLATDWIAILFTSINVFYRSDLDVILLQGTTFLRTAPDPYNNLNTPASEAQLIEFGNYWQNNHAAVPRAFAMLLSGKSSSGNSASGIAWLDRYCQTLGTFGSYSVNQVFTNPGIGAASNAFLVGHELGHNFGALHTHCANATTGAGNTNTNTIDQCFNGESPRGCYGGAPSCPSSGPGAPKGTLMSYCHTNAPAGANCTSNVLQFHPTHVTQLRNRIAANTPSCLKSETIFTNGFQ